MKYVQYILLDGGVTISVEDRYILPTNKCFIIQSLGLMRRQMETDATNTVKRLIKISDENLHSPNSLNNN